MCFILLNCVLTLSIDLIFDAYNNSHRFKDLNKPDEVTTSCTTLMTIVLPAIITTGMALPDDRKFESSCTQNPIMSIDEMHVFKCI